LVKQVFNLTEQIHKHHFNKSVKEIQIDCDWTQTTKKRYFELLSTLKSKLKISV